MDESMISLGMVLALIFIAVIAIVIFFQFIPFGLWLTALFSGIRVFRSRMTPRLWRNARVVPGVPSGGSTQPTTSPRSLMPRALLLS